MNISILEPHMIVDQQKIDDHVKPFQIFAFIWLLVLLLLTIWLFKQKSFSFIHESGLAIFYGAFLGIFIKYGHGVVIYLIGHTPIKFGDELLFPLNFTNKSDYDTGNNGSGISSNFSEILLYVLLPPIIFNAGYTVNQKGFFKHFGGILLYAFLGTFISCFAIGGILFAIVYYAGVASSYVKFADCLLFGAIISATDPITTLAIFNSQSVDPDVYSVVFGESILNDVSSIVLTQLIETSRMNDAFEAINLLYSFGNFCRILFGALIIGFTIGCINSLITKFTNINKCPMIESGILLLISYSSFFLSEALELSGIVTILVCGLVQAHYTYKNLSQESRGQISQILDLLNFFSDNLIFIYIGYSTFASQTHQWVIWFILGSFLAIFIGRVLNIYALSFMINLTRRKNYKIPLNIQHLLLFSGLRGGMSFCLAIKDTSTQARKLMLTATSMIVIVTVLFNGGLTKNVIKILKIKSEKEAKDEMIEGDINKKKWKTIWKKVDQKIMLPFLTNYKIANDQNKLRAPKENYETEDSKFQNALIDIGEIKLEAEIPS